VSLPRCHCQQFCFLLGRELIVCRWFITVHCALFSHWRAIKSIWFVSPWQGWKGSYVILLRDHISKWDIVFKMTTVCASKTSLACRIWCMLQVKMTNSMKMKWNQLHFNKKLHSNARHSPRLEWLSLQLQFLSVVIVSSVNFNTLNCSSETNVSWIWIDFLNQWRIRL